MRWTIGASKVQARASSASTLKRSKAAIEEEEDEEEEEEEFDDLDSPDDGSALTTQQVHTLMNVVCEETDIAEVELKMGGFTMKVKRKSTPTAVSPAPPATAGNGAAPGPTSANELPFQSTQSMDESQLLPPQLPNGGSASSMDEEDYNEQFIYLGAPKVGVFRRGRYMKGKKIGKANVAEEGSRVKKGQALAYIEQLGTYVPVEAPQAGEIVTFNIEEGVAVEYKEVVVEMAPFFGGHIIGDKKYA